LEDIFFIQKISDKRKIEKEIKFMFRNLSLPFKSEFLNSYPQLLHREYFLCQHLHHLQQK